jgi:hypothetical protein
MTSHRIETSTTTGANAGIRANAGTVTDRPARRRAGERARRCRTFALCDVENLTGQDPRTVAQGQLDAAVDAFTRRAELVVGDLVVVAANPALAFAAAGALPSARVRCRGGRDGADLVLLDELADPDHLARRFDRVVLGSGDGIFTEAVIRLNHAGLRTVVVADFRRLSRRLRLAAQAVRPLGLGSPGPAHEVVPASA